MSFEFFRHKYISTKELQDWAMSNEFLILMSFCSSVKKEQVFLGRDDVWPRPKREKL